MAIFHSMLSVVGYTLITVALLLWYGTGRHPLASARVFARSLIASPKYLICFVSLVAILMVNKYEMKLEMLLPIHYNLTSTLSGWEGSWQGDLQNALQSHWLTTVCSFFYLVLLQAVLVASIGIYTFAGNLRLYYAFSVAILLNYLIAVPFFLFVPVDEAWSVSPHIHFLILDAFPNFESEYRQLSGLDNCFPSLHTSLSVTMALIAARSGNRRWAWFAGANAAIILFSIFYLGIHWFTDMVGGLCLACFVSWAGLRIGTRIVRGPAAADEQQADKPKWSTATSRTTGS